MTPADRPEPNSVGARKSSTKKVAAKKVATKKVAAKKAASPRRPPEPRPTQADLDDDLWGGDWDDLERDGGMTWNVSDGTGGGSRSASSTDGTDLIQSAALELITAAGNALDVAEELVADPHAIGAALESLRGIVGEVARAAAKGSARTPYGSDAPADDFQVIHLDED